MCAKNVSSVKNRSHIMQGLVSIAIFLFTCDVVEAVVLVVQLVQVGQVVVQLLNVTFGRHFVLKTRNTKMFFFSFLKFVVVREMVGNQVFFVFSSSCSSLNYLPSRM
jgi:hypothetical protein